MASCKIAVDRSYTKIKMDNKKTDFIPFEQLGKPMENTSSIYLQKGKLVEIEGELHIDKYGKMKHGKIKELYKC